MPLTCQSSSSTSLATVTATGVSCSGSSFRRAVTSTVSRASGGAAGLASGVSVDCACASVPGDGVKNAANVRRAASAADFRRVEKPSIEMLRSGTSSEAKLAILGRSTRIPNTKCRLQRRTGGDMTCISALIQVSPFGRWQLAAQTRGLTPSCYRQISWEQP